MSPNAFKNEFTYSSYQKILERVRRAEYKNTALAVDWLNLFTYYNAYSGYSLAILEKMKSFEGISGQAKKVISAIEKEPKNPKNRFYYNMLRWYMFTKDPATFISTFGEHSKAELIALTQYIRNYDRPWDLSFDIQPIAIPENAVGSLVKVLYEHGSSIIKLKPGGAVNSSLKMPQLHYNLRTEIAAIQVVTAHMFKDYELGKATLAINKTLTNKSDAREVSGLSYAPDSEAQLTTPMEIPFTYRINLDDTSKQYEQVLQKDNLVATDNLNAVGSIFQLHTLAYLNQIFRPWLSLMCGLRLINFNMDYYRGAAAIDAMPRKLNQFYQGLMEIGAKKGPGGFVSFTAPAYLYSYIGFNSTLIPPLILAHLPETRVSVFSNTKIIEHLQNKLPIATLNALECARTNTTISIAIRIHQELNYLIELIDHVALRLPKNSQEYSIALPFTIEGRLLIGLLANIYNLLLNLNNSISTSSILNKTLQDINLVLNAAKIQLETSYRADTTDALRPALVNFAHTLLSIINKLAIAPEVLSSNLRMSVVTRILNNIEQLISHHTALPFAIYSLLDPYAYSTNVALSEFVPTVDKMKGAPLPPTHLASLPSLLQNYVQHLLNRVPIKNKSLYDNLHFFNLTNYKTTEKQIADFDKQISMLLTTNVTRTAGPTIPNISKSGTQYSQIVSAKDMFLTVTLKINNQVKTFEDISEALKEHYRAVPFLLKGMLLTHSFSQNGFQYMRTTSSIIQHIPHDDSVEMYLQQLFKWVYKSRTLSNDILQGTLEQYNIMGISTKALGKLLDDSIQ